MSSINCCWVVESINPNERGGGRRGEVEDRRREEEGEETEGG
jgi:hypothetical protein